MAGLFQVLYGDAAGDFVEAQTLTGTDGKPLIIPITGQEEIRKTICTRPTAVDWDGDGDLDIVAGNLEGTFFLFDGLGEGKFEPDPKPLETASGQQLQLAGLHSDPAVVDWDGDGDLDIVSGSGKGGVFWAENRDGALSEFKTIFDAAPRVEFGSLLGLDDLSGPSQDTRVWVADVDSDGKLDLLVGDTVRLTAAVDGLSEDDVREAHNKWWKQVSVLSQKMRGADFSTEEGRAVSLEYRKHYSSRSEFVDETKTGFIWFYRQK